MYATDGANKGFYWDDGTTLAPVDTTGGAGGLDLAWGTVLGTAGEVGTGDADESVLATAITNTAAGGTLVILPSYVAVENVTLAKQLHIEGRAGQGSAMNGTLNVQAGGANSSFSNFQFKDDVTVDDGADGLLCNDNMSIANGKNITDNNVTFTGRVKDAGNLYELVRL